MLFIILLNLIDNWKTNYYKSYENYWYLKNFWKYITILTVFKRKDEEITCFDARETAPLNSSKDMFKNYSKTKGGLAIAVPGEIKG